MVIVKCDSEGGGGWNLAGASPRRAIVVDACHGIVSACSKRNAEFTDASWLLAAVRHLRRIRAQTLDSRAPCDIFGWSVSTTAVVSPCASSRVP